MSDPVEQVAAAVGRHEAWQRPDRTWECACGKRYGLKINHDFHVAQAVIAELGLAEQVGERHDPKLPWDHPGFPEHRWATRWEPIQ